jgi:cation:H+ antiporter
MIDRDFPIMVLTTLACLPIFWTQGVITRLEGGILVALYGLYLGEQLLLNQAPSFVNEYRLALLVLALPLLLTFLTWSVLHWRRQRRRGPSASLPGGTGSV